MIEPNDWRLANQMGYLRDAVLVWKEYTAPGETWEHDHCEFCWTKFMEKGPLDNEAQIERAGYTTEDERHWICRRCFDDFRAMFQWTVRSD